MSDKKTNISSKEIIDIFKNNSNFHVTYFDENYLINSTQGEIKEALSYVTNYEGYEGKNFAYIHDADFSLLKKFASADAEFEKKWPNEVKYGKIIVDWKNKLNNL